MIILIDGPEKAGKSTLAKVLAEQLHGTIRRWGPVDPDDRVYTPFLKEDSMSTRWFIWDRGWPSEHVYGKLLNRDRRLTSDPWLGEWLHGRAVQTSGVRVILLPTGAVDTGDLRDSSDLPVNPRAEFEAFMQYGKDFDYLMLTNYYTEDSVLSNAELIISRLGAANIIPPPKYAGYPNAKVVFVGERRNDKSKMIPPGSWLPFTSRLTSELGRRLGPKAMQCGWTNVGDVPLEFLANKFVVACGEVAAEWLENSGIARLVIPHPAWLYRYNTAAARNKRDLTDKILTLIGDFQNE